MCQGEGEGGHEGTVGGGPGREGPPETREGGLTLRQLRLQILPPLAQAAFTRSDASFALEPQMGEGSVLGVAHPDNLPISR